MAKYCITLSKKQLEAVRDALELRFRIDLGQEFELADLLARKNVDFNPKNPNRQRIFDEYIQRKDHISIILKALFEIAQPKWLQSHGRDEDALICEDVWQVIRYQLAQDYPKKFSYEVNGRFPLQCSNETLPTITKIEKTVEPKKSNSGRDGE